MAVISDSSPLILYAKIGRLELLREIFSTVIIPSAVHHEVVLARRDYPGSAEVAAAPWVIAQPLQVPGSVLELSPELDRGEAEVIALALEMSGQTPVLMDDLAGRREARSQSLTIFGSTGILLLAKELGLVPRIRPILQEPRSAGLYLSDRVYRDALASAGETTAS